MPATSFAQTSARPNPGRSIGAAASERPGEANALGHGTVLATLPRTVEDTPEAIAAIPQDSSRSKASHPWNTGPAQPARHHGLHRRRRHAQRQAVQGPSFDARDDGYVDGLRDFGVYTRASFAFEEVQVLKGPSSTMFSRGQHEGVIETVFQDAVPGRALQHRRCIAKKVAYDRGLADVNRQIDDTTAIRNQFDGQREPWGGARSRQIGPLGI